MVSPTSKRDAAEKWFDCETLHDVSADSPKSFELLPLDPLAIFRHVAGSAPALGAIEFNPAARGSLSERASRGVRIRSSRRSLKPPFFHARKQSGGFDAKKFGGTLGTLDFPVRLFQDGQEVVALPALKFGFGQNFRCRHTVLPGVRTGTEPR